MVWGIEGHSLASKEYKDKQRFIDNSYAWFTRLLDGTVVDGTAFYSISFNDLWNRVQPRR